VAKRYGVSHIVVREAFHILQGEGILIRAKSGSRLVFTMDASKASDLAVLRASLESLAAYWAAERLTESWKERIVQAGAKMRQYPATNLAEVFGLELINNFWRRIYLLGKTGSVLTVPC